MSLSSPKFEVLAIWLMLLALSQAFPSRLCGGDVNGLHYELVDNQVRIIGADSDLKTIEIPAAIEGYAVTVVGENAFRNHRAEGVVLSEGLQGIENGAFSSCTRLKSLRTPRTLQTIGKGAFQKCQSLTNVILDGDELFVGEEAFIWNYGLSSVQIGSGVYAIQNKAFNYCGELKRVDFEDGVRVLGQNIFASSVVEELNLPGSVENIAAGAFAGMRYLIEIKVDPANDKYQSHEGILYSRDRKELHTCPAGRKGPAIVVEGVEHILHHAFEGCHDLASISFPDTLLAIGDYAFRNCYQLSDLNFSKGLVNIGRGAFWSCEELESVRIPETLSKIGDVAFYDCRSLNSIIITNPQIEIGLKAFEDRGGLARRRAEVVIPYSFHSSEESKRIGLSPSYYFKVPENENKLLQIKFYNNWRGDTYLLVLCHPLDSAINTVILESSNNPGGPWVFFDEVKVENRIGSSTLQVYEDSPMFFRVKEMRR